MEVEAETPSVLTEDAPAPEKLEKIVAEIGSVPEKETENNSVSEESAEVKEQEKQIPWEKISSEITEKDVAEEVHILPENGASSTSENGVTEVPEPATCTEESDCITTADVAKETEEGDVETTKINEEKEAVSAETSSEALEYTVIEADEVETHEIIEEHIAQTRPVETLLIINDSVESEEEVYLIEDKEALEDDPEEAKQEKPKKKQGKQRGRKPIGDVPLHILGRDISKPGTPSNGGRTMPKARLGVKVPYRNLTSQIVSKAEIEKEIMDRFKTKQEQNAINSANVSFTRKLTQRLAKRIIPEIEREELEASSISTSTSSKAASTSIRDESDLLAILEGDDDDVDDADARKAEPVAVVKAEVKKETEKEIALRQLKELPLLDATPAPVKKIFKTKIIERHDAPPKPETRATATKTAEKVDQIEPRLKTGVVVKTYTRKRKSSEDDAPTPSLLPSKKAPSPLLPVTVNPKSLDDSSSSTSAYITKSSRIIKRKVIWDPDEAPATPTPTKSPIKMLKPESNPKAAEKSLPVVTTPTSSKKPKRLTEVDKLLMDEGAVNMLYDIKTDNEVSKKKAKLSQQSIEKRTNVIKNDLQSTSKEAGMKSLRKKEVLSPSSPKKVAPPPQFVAKKEVMKAPTPSSVVGRKKSRDSARSSVASPPASPGYSAEASRIIRRHSSSSFSSTDGGEASVDNERVTRARKGSNVVQETAKKKLKKANEANVKPKGDAKTSTSNNNNTENDEDDGKEVEEYGDYETFRATKGDDLVQICLYHKNDKKCFLSEKLLKELTHCLKELNRDGECNVVVVTSANSKVFCGGLDYQVLVNDNEVVRKKKATEISNLVKEFLKCLLSFKKVLVAGIQGECIGLGVAMLPLFDMIIASDTSTFSAPYSKLGSVAEAGFLFTLPTHFNNHGLASELFYSGEVLKAADVFRRGLVTKLCWPEKYEEELLATIGEIASRSSQSLEATKMQLRQHIIEPTEKLLNSIGKTLVQHWTSVECQKNFVKLGK